MPPRRQPTKPQQTSPESTAKTLSHSERVRIRMYRQGLGDCFLLTFNQTTHVLIDCGVIVGTENPEPIMTRVVENIRATTGGKVDVLVVTHEHWDHVSGFTQAQSTFDKIEFKEVWMAWTEDPKNELAMRLRAEREKKKQALKAAVARLSDSKHPAAAELHAGLTQLLGFTGLGAAAADGGGNTGEAMAYARGRGQRGTSQLRFLHPGQPPLPVPGAEPIRIYVLGPPEREDLLKRSDPSQAHSEVYLSPAVSLLTALAPGASDPATKEASFPFAEGRRIPVRNGRLGSAASPELKRLFQTRYAAESESYRTIEEDWLASAGGLALQLDSDTNNTSLVLAFELADTGEVFLFPGDAQVGNWLSWDLYSWNVKTLSGHPTTVKAADLLARTVFYKVGHHGSHNATLKALGLERMTHADLVAMIPVNEPMAKKKRWRMPWPDLLERLEQKCETVIRQDEAEQAKTPRRGRIELGSATSNQPSLYVDYFL